MKTLAMALALGTACVGTFAQEADPLTADYGWTSGASSGARSEAGTELELAAAASALPQPQTRGDVTWVCGGIGENEAQYMSRQAADYDMKLTFASQDGAFLAGATVRLVNAHGATVLQTRCDAPIMLVDVPRGGTYRVEAEIEGHAQMRRVRVRDEQHVANVVVTWPQRVVAQIEEEAARRTSSGASQPADSAAGTGGPEWQPDMPDRMGEKPYLAPGSIR
ncbi:MAG TPA: hypothetical protein VIG66_07880 [Noviherbaspirillum sp.]